MQDRKECTSQDWDSISGEWRCVHDGFPCSEKDVRPVESCPRMEKDPERGHFCPDCIGNGQYRQVYREKDCTHSLHECACGKTWPTLRAYLEEMKNALDDLAADNAHELATACQEQRARAWAAVGWASL